jgi:hypothetical protein
LASHYDTRVTIPSLELTHIVRDLSQLGEGESVHIEVNKEGMPFASDGKAGNGTGELHTDYRVKVREG